MNLTWMFWVGSRMLGLAVLACISIICYHNSSQPRRASRLLARAPPFPPPHAPPPPPWYPHPPGPPSTAIAMRMTLSFTSTNSQPYYTPKHLCRSKTPHMAADYYHA
jgi:hypothetical protein